MLAPLAAFPHDRAMHRAVSPSRWLAWGTAIGAIAGATAFGANLNVDIPHERSQFIFLALAGACAGAGGAATAFSLLHGRGWLHDVNWPRGLWRLWAALALPWAAVFVVPVLMEAAGRSVQGGRFSRYVEESLELAIGVPALFAAPLYAATAWAWIGAGFRKAPPAAP